MVLTYRLRKRKRYFCIISPEIDVLRTEFHDFFIQVTLALFHKVHKPYLR